MSSHIAGVLHSTPPPVWLPQPTDVNTLMPELWSTGTTKGDDGVLRVAGHAVTDLAAEFGTPVTLFDVEDFRTRAREFREAFESAFTGVGSDATVFYAGKAFLCSSVARWIDDLGLSLDVCTLGELRIAQRAGFPGGRLGLHGNNKSDEEIRAALEYGVGRIVIDSLPEVERVARIAGELGVVAPVMVRLTVGVEAHTHDFIATAHEDQKFGLSITGGAAAEALRAIAARPELLLVGLHSHIGSQIFDAEGFEVAASRVLALRAEAMRTIGLDVPEVDLGGGFGIAYTSQDDPRTPAELAQALADVVKRTCERLGTNVPAVSIEPGRALVGPAGATLYTVGTIKEVDTGSGLRVYASVDGGMSDNVRTALYGADYSCTLAGRRSDAEPRVTRVVGKHCESGDIVVRDEYTPADLTAGDLLAVPGTGAYCRSLASNYNAVPRPGVLALWPGRAEWIVRPETLDDIFATDIPVDRKENA